MDDADIEAKLDPKSVELVDLLDDRYFEMGRTKIKDIYPRTELGTVRKASRSIPMT